MPAPTDFHRLPAACRKLGLWLFLLLLGIYVTLTRGHFFTTDEITVYQQTRSLWEHGGLSVTPLPNSLPGRDGRYYGVYGVGQSVLALPFYGIGKAAHVSLSRVGAHTALAVLAGPIIGQPPDHLWGGEVEIFFVNLFNAVVVAALGAVFFFCSLRLGAEPRWALASTLILALTTHLTGFATGFYQHAAEALFALCAFDALLRDAAKSRWKSRLAAGASAGAMLLVRINTAVLLPSLTGYLLFHTGRRLPEGAFRDRLLLLLRRCLPFFLPIGVALLIAAAVSEWKFGVFDIRGAYARTLGFTTPLLLGLYGNLFSVGESIFLFSPILILSPVYFRGFARRYPSETAAILCMALSSLLLYSKIDLWHGQMCFGPRYLVHLVPFLLLPLGLWLRAAPKRVWIAVGAMAGAGAVVEILHVFVNIGYVWHHEGYQYSEPFPFLFLPSQSQLLAHWRALLAWDNRVDTWLVNTARLSGAHATVPIAICLAWFLAWCLRQVVRYSREAQQTFRTP